MIHHPAGPEGGVGLLVGGEGYLDVHQRLGAGGPERTQGEEQRGDRALHVRRAAPVDPAVLNSTGKRRAVLPRARDRDHIVVGVEMDRLPRAAARAEAKHVVTGKPVLFARQGALQQRRRDRVAPGLEPGSRQFLHQERGDHAIVDPGWINRRDAHQGP